MEAVIGRGALHVQVQALESHSRLKGQSRRMCSWSSNRARIRLTVCSASSEAGDDKLGGEEDLARKLAKAEAEAKELRQELEQRKISEAASGSVKRGGPKIDGFGVRETLFSGPRTTGKLAKKDGAASDWGLSETDFLQAEGGLAQLKKEYGTDSNDKVISKTEANSIIQRRLLIGGGLSALAIGLSTIDIPVTVSKPTKPLFIYLVPLLRLQAALATVQEQAEYLDALGLRSQLKLATGSMSAVKENLLNVTALLNGPTEATARSLAFDVLGYLEQADYSKYFEGMGVPGPYQQGEYIKFSLQSLQVAQGKLALFLSYVPAESLQAAKDQLDGAGSL